MEEGVEISGIWVREDIRMDPRGSQQDDDVEDNSQPMVDVITTHGMLYSLNKNCINCVIYISDFPNAQINI